MWVKDIDLNIGDIVGDLENSPNKVYATIFQVVDIKTKPLKQFEL